ncbi:GGDEF domain-containing protein [Streptomyces sp. B1866]|uniref:GGDEF domain-containing protein n=1 Tax=Streptomyces sp. B1866 TaxID=3075431 RepID=UPI00288DD22B|nr:GGDEF domain-containing protein [Streptomyces sp. B1866]MDT3395761.1 GGDEF domain-containing protein [Streptomyces sp. B1866]
MTPDALHTLAAAAPLAAGWAVHGLWWRRRLAAARRDPLSGLVGRAVFERAACRVLAGRRPVAVLVIDLDGFKQVNDRFGHAAGDAVIRATGERLAQWADGLGVAGRLGGDEFAAAVRVDSADALRGELVHLHQWLCSPVPRPDGPPLVVGASIGAYLVPSRAGADLSVALRRADESMYLAKQVKGGWLVADGPAPVHATVWGRRDGRPGTHLPAPAEGNAR